MGFCSEAAIGGSRECNESEPMVCYMVNSESGTGDSIRANKKLSLTRMCPCPCPKSCSTQCSETILIGQGHGYGFFGQGQGISLLFTLYSQLFKLLYKLFIEVSQ